MEILLDDAAPEVLFFSTSDGWIQDHRVGSKYPDTNLSSFSEKTFHATFTNGDHMQYHFNGTGITIFGSKANNHGVYGVKIDDEEETFYSGFSTNSIFQTELYNRNNLTRDKEHVITVTNYPTRTEPKASGTSDGWLDIDHVVIKQDIVGDVKTTIIDDSAPEIIYDATWVKGVAEAANYNGTIHFTSQSRGSMILPFTGTSIQTFSGLNTDHYEYAMSLDGGPEVTFSGNHFQRVFQVPHYTASGLTDGPHTLKITNRGTSGLPVLGFDYAVVNSTSSARVSGGSVTSQQGKPTFLPTSAPNADSETSESGSKSKNAPAIAGGVVGAIVGLTVLGILAWCLLCRKPRKVNNKHKSYIDFPTNNSSINQSEHKSTTFTSRSRMISNASGMSTKANTNSEKDPLSPTAFGSLRGMFKKKPSELDIDTATVRSASPGGSIAYFYKPNTNQISRTLSSGSSDILGHSTLPRSGQLDSFDNQIYRNPPISRTRPPIIPETNTNNNSGDSNQQGRSRHSTTSRSSAYSQGGETYLTDRLDNISRAFSNRAQSPVPLPSPPSQESSEYEHMPLPPLPTSTTINNALSSRSPSERPTLIHADASSTLLPAATIRQSVGSSLPPTIAPIVETPVATTGTSSTNASPSSTLATSQVASPDTPGDYKRSILGLTLDTSYLQTPSTEQDSSTGSGRWINLTPGSVLDMEPPILSPPPEYSHVMTAQQQQQRT